MIRIIPVECDEHILGMQRLRWDVFVTEQSVPPVLEIDALDYAATTTHVVALDDDNQVVGTARILGEETPGQVHLGRLAVAKSQRGTGLGREIMLAAQRIAFERYAIENLQGKSAGEKTLVIELLAQAYASGFYAKLGYEIISDIIVDAGIDHYMMRTVITG